VVEAAAVQLVPAAKLNVTVTVRGCVSIRKVTLGLRGPPCAIITIR
jgi:hypothetical protein